MKKQPQIGDIWKDGTPYLILEIDGEIHFGYFIVAYRFRNKKVERWQWFPNDILLYRAGTKVEKINEE